MPRNFSSRSSRFSVSNRPARSVVLTQTQSDETDASIEDGMNQQLNRTERRDNQRNRFDVENNEIIRGNEDDNTYAGDSGNNYMVGSLGNDFISGGDGVDTLSYRNIDGQVTLVRGGYIELEDGSTDVITDYSIERIIGGNDQNNTIDGSTGLIASLDIDLSQNDLTINGLPGIGSASLSVERFNNIIGSETSDNLVGDNRRNEISGGAGDDLIQGNGGRDILTGGIGSDQFIFSSRSSRRGFDSIMDLEIGEDIIVSNNQVSDIESIGNVENLGQESLSQLLNGSSFESNGAATITFDDRTFLAINFGNSDFRSSSDPLVEITGYSGNLTDLSISSSGMELLA